jgi:hypothetical protein
LEIIDMVVADSTVRVEIGTRLFAVLSPLARSGRCWISLCRTEETSLDIFEAARWTAVTLRDPVVMLAP